MSPEANEVVARRLIEVHNTKDFATLDELFAPNYIDHTAPPGQNDAAARKQRIIMYCTAAPDLHCAIDEVIASGDKVVLRWTTRATHTGAPLQTPLGEVMPAGRQTAVSGVNVLHIADGRIAEEWSYWDEVAWLQQLGALPAAAGTTG